MTSLWLIGMMGSGKTAVGRRVAESTGATFIDTDAEVAESHGSSIAEMWRLEGESFFRRLEEEAVSGAALSGPAVVATGGGVVVNGVNVARMRASGVVVWLSASPRVLARRVGPGSHRPLLAGSTDPESTLADLLERRSDSYRRAAHAVVTTDSLTIDEVVEEVIAAWTGS